MVFYRNKKEPFGSFFIILQKSVSICRKKFGAGNETNAELLSLSLLTLI